MTRDVGSRIRAFRPRGLLAAGLVLLLPLVLLALAGPLVLTHDATTIDPVNKLQPWSTAHLIGTDEFGRDVLSRIVVGMRLSLWIGALVAIVSGLAGVVFGSLAGYYRRLDAVVMVVMDALMTFPGLLLAILMMAVFGPGYLNVVAAMVLLYTPRVVRVVRAAFIETRTLEYVEAARLSGATDWRIIVGHLLPASFGALSVQVTFGFAWAMLVEAGLSFLGLGTPPPSPSLGAMISDGREFLRVAPWLVIAPGAVVSTAVMGLNLVGDGLRDLLDPRSA